MFRAIGTVRWEKIYHQSYLLLTQGNPSCHRGGLLRSLRQFSRFPRWQEYIIGAQDTNSCIKISFYGPFTSKNASTGEGHLCVTSRIRGVNAFTSSPGLSEHIWKSEKLFGGHRINFKPFSAPIAAKCPISEIHRKADIDGGLWNFWTGFACGIACDCEAYIARG
jgi:hypothetical protein